MTGLARRLRRAAVPGVPLVALTLDVVSDGRVARLERTRGARRHRGAGRWPMVTLVGSRPALVALSLTATLVARRRGRPVLEPVVPVLAGTVARAGLMLLVDRDRPPRERWLAEPTGAAYPSRHATACALGVLALRDALPRSRTVDALAAGTVAVAGWSRLRLGVHWPSDVAGGVLLAATVHAALGRGLSDPGAG
ncbi:MAG TPA: phosphatase PAP2 family protein [Marmoricola sp.]|nr:phosphatase PAP2 family protein [Marmoricola sp.]